MKLSLTLAPLSRVIGMPADDDTEILRRVDLMLARAAIERLDAIEADLGQLSLRTAAILAQEGGPKDANGWPLLVEACDLTFSGGWWGD